MDSPSRPRKRGSENQLDNQIEPDNTKRSKASLECILEPIPAGYPKQQNRMDGQGPITNYHNMFAVPISTSKEDQGIALARQPVFPGVWINHNDPYNPVIEGEGQALDYQFQLLLLEQQSKKRQMEQNTALRTITSLPDQLNIAHTSVKALLKNLPTYFQNIEDFRCSIPGYIETLQDHEEKLDEKDTEIKSLENKYNELIEMTPGAQRGELRQVRDRAILLMQQHREYWRMNRDDAAKEVEKGNGRSKGLEVAQVGSWFRRVRSGDGS